MGHETGAYLVGEEDSNIVSHFKIRKGDVEAALPLLMLLSKIPTGFLADHAYLEPESGVHGGRK